MINDNSTVSRTPAAATGDPRSGENSNRDGATSLCGEVTPQVEAMTDQEKLLPCNQQNDDMLVGRIIAMKSMIAQFQNEIKQLEGNLASRKLRREQSTQSPAPSMGEWQPIETAPADQILLFNPSVCDGRNQLPELIRIGFKGDWPNRKPTHWMPLPAPPAYRRGQEDEKGVQQCPTCGCFWSRGQ